MERGGGNGAVTEARDRWGDRTLRCHWYDRPSARTAHRRAAGTVGCQRLSAFPETAGPTLHSTHVSNQSRSAN